MQVLTFVDSNFATNHITLDVWSGEDDMYIEYLATIFAEKGLSVELIPNVFLYRTPDNTFIVESGCGDPITDEQFSAHEALEQFRVIEQHHQSYAEAQF